MTCLALIGSACGSEEEPVTTGRRDAGKDDEDDNDKGKDAAVAQCIGAETRSCSCGSDTKVMGKNACRSGKWSSACAGCPSSGNTPAPSDLCKAGYFKGDFTGKYRPGAFGGGLFPSGFEVDITGKALNSIPALAFSLEETATGVGEFQSFSVGGGCMQGSAQALGFIDNPFVARITGDLDCSTGFFNGWLTGQYNLINTGAIFNFQGPLTAQFELPGTLSDGDWVVAEPDSVLGGPQGGGEGTWGAMFDSDKAPELAVDPCAAIPIADAGLPPPKPPTTTKPDAGTTTKSDAGVK